MNKAVFLDRDGVVNRKAQTEDGYVTCWEEMEILPGVVEAITLLNRAGFRVLVVSNQRCVAKGLVTTSNLESLHRRMCRELSTVGAKIDDVYYCPHDEHPPCTCRKPNPGMLFAAADKYQVDLASSWMIGDSKSDVEAGRRAGCRTARILRPPLNDDGNADVRARSLLDAVHAILRLEDDTCHRDEMDLLRSSSRGGHESAGLRSR